MIQTDGIPELEKRTVSKSGPEDYFVGMKTI